MACGGQDFPKHMWPVVAHLVPTPLTGGDKVPHEVLPWT